mgnify:CR=1 FL=1
MKELEKMLNLGSDYKIEKQEEKIEKGKIVKVVYVSCKKKKDKCPECGKYTSSIHDKLKPIELKYLKIVEYSLKIIITKRRFICHNCKKKFTENVDINNDKCNISNKLKQKILKDLLSYNLSLKYIAGENNTSEDTVRTILKEAMEGYPEHVRHLPKVISMDEFKADTNKGKYAFILNDPIHKKTLDILPNRKKEYLIQYFTYTENRHSVEFVISDMYEPYLLVTQIMFPKAKYVVDPFHYTTYIMDALDNVRIRLQKEYGYSSKEYRMLKNKKNVSLLRKYSNDIEWFTYTKRYKNRHTIEILNYDIRKQLLEINGELELAYQLKELFLDIINHATYENAKVQFINWVELCRENKIEEFIEASNTIENWLEYIVNSFIDERYSNGFTEGLNNKIKVIKRVGFGYKNFDFFRIRLLYILNGKITLNSKKDGFKKN